MRPVNTTSNYSTAQLRMGEESEGEVKRLSITEARKICESLGARGVIVIVFDEDDMAGTSYGATRAECADLGRTLDAIIDEISSGRIGVWS